MKKWIVASVFLSIVTSAHATIIAYDDFSGGTVGTAISGRTALTGGGIWTNQASSSQVLAAVNYGSGNTAVSATGANGALALSGDFSQTGVGANIIKLSMDLTPNDHGSISGTERLTFGFFTQIDKGLIINTTTNTGDALMHEFQFQNYGSATNEGSGWAYVIANNTKTAIGWPDQPDNLLEVGTADTVRLTMQYNFVTGAAEITTFFVNSGTIIGSKQYSLQAGLSFDYVAFGWSLSDTSAVANPSTITNVTVEAIPEPATLSLFGVTAIFALLLRRLTRS